jgi:hypothetical protein
MPVQRICGTVFVTPETSRLLLLQPNGLAFVYLAEALAERGHRLAPNTVGRLLRDLGYSLQANRKDKEGRSPPERSAQVTYLNNLVRAFLDRGQPVISVDAKKKELLATSRMLDAPGNPRDSQFACRSTTFRR